MLKENYVRKGFFEHAEFIALRVELPEHLKGFVTFAYKTGLSSAGESHPHALSERHVTVSRHTAPASLSLETSRSQAYAERNPVPPSCLVDHRLPRAGSSPSLHLHYRDFITTTG